jgi:Fe-S cluster biogenesis protein NfuA
MPTDSRPFLEQMRRVEALVSEVEQGTDPAARTAAQDLVRILLDIHAGALGKTLTFMSESEREACAADELVSPVLLLHGLHPWDLEARVRHALDKVQPLVRRGGGEVELLEVEAERVRIHLDAAPGCGSTVAALKGAIERSILDAAPEVTAVDIEGVGEPIAALLQVGTLSRNGHSSVADASEKREDRVAEAALAAR